MSDVVRSDQSLRLLLVDDEPRLTDLLSEELVDQGYYVEVASTISEAWQFLNQDVFDKTPKATRPDFVHFLDADVLGDAIEKTGFSIEESYYFDVETPPLHPYIFGGDGRCITVLLDIHKRR